jgi:HK97 family phage portal protein
MLSLTSFRDRLRIAWQVLARQGAFKAAPRTGHGDDVMRLTGQHAEYEYPDISKFDTQTKAYSQSSWLYTAINLVARTSALVNLNVYELSGEKKTAVVNHPLEQLLRRPNSFQTQMEFMEATVGFLLLTGNAYWYLNGAPGKPTELLLLRPNYIWIVPGTDSSRPVAGYVYEVDGIELPLQAEEVAHFSFFNPGSYYYGLSPMEVAALPAQSDVAASLWNRNFFSGEKAVPAGLVNIKNLVSNPDYERIQKEWKESYGGTQRKTAFIRGADVEFQGIGLSQKDMDFTAGRQFSKEELFQIIGVPPGVLDKNATEANARAGMELLTGMTIWPLMNRIGQKATVAIASLYGDNLVVEPDDIRVKDAQAEREELRSVAEFMSINEIRGKYLQLDPYNDPEADKPTLLLKAASAFGTIDNPLKPDPQAPGQEKMPAPGTNDSKAIDVIATPTDIPQIYMTRAIRREIEQFLKYAGKGKDINAFVFNAVPLPLELAIKALADCKQLDIIATKADPDGKAEKILMRAFTDYLAGARDRAIRGVRHVNSPGTGKSLPDLKRFQSYFDDTFWENELNQLAGLIATVIQDIITRAAEDAADALHMTSGISVDSAAFLSKAAEYAASYTDTVLQAFNSTTREGFGALLQRYIMDPEAKLTDLVSAIQESGLFSGDRAKLAAITENTRAQGAGTFIAGEALAEAAGVEVVVSQEDFDSLMPAHPGDRCRGDAVYIYDDNGRITGMDYIWRTIEDGRVCSICDGRDGRLFSEILAEAA